MLRTCSNEHSNARRNAHWIGRALRTSVMPSSSRACACNALWAISLLCHLLCVCGVKTATYVNCCQLPMFTLRIYSDFLALQPQVCFFSVLAAAPQSSTRNAPFTTAAPPARIRSWNIFDLSCSSWRSRCIGIKTRCGARLEMRRGSPAPTAKLTADVSAACHSEQQTGGR